MKKEKTDPPALPVIPEDLARRETKGLRAEMVPPEPRERGGKMVFRESEVRLGQEDSEAEWDDQEVSASLDQRETPASLDLLDRWENKVFLDLRGLEDLLGRLDCRVFPERTDPLDSQAREALQENTDHPDHRETLE